MRQDNLQRQIGPPPRPPPHGAAAAALERYSHPYNGGATTCTRPELYTHSAPFAMDEVRRLFANERGATPNPHPLTPTLSPNPKPNSDPLYPNPNPNQVPRFTTFAKEEAAIALAAREASRFRWNPNPSLTLARALILALPRRRAFRWNPIQMGP